MAKKKRKKAAPKPVRLKPENFVKKKARSIALHQCYINSDWQEGGMATVIVVRKMRNGNLIVGSYIVDVYCLGVKDTFFKTNLAEHQFEEELLPIYTERMGLDMVKIEPTLAFNIVYGAVEYAEDLGFEPHKDFKITEYILDDVESIDYMDIEFGKDGKPHYMSGPHDNIERIIAVLDKNVGSGNYHYAVHVDGLEEEIFEEEDMYDDYEEVE